MPAFFTYRAMFLSLLSLTGLMVVPTVYAKEKSHPVSVEMGSVAMDVPAEMVRRLMPLSKYISLKTGLNVTFRASPNLTSAVDDLGAGSTQIAYLTPVAYIEAHEKYGAIPLVSPLTRGKSTFNLMIVVKKDSAIKATRDLVGKKFAFGDKKALLQSAVVVSSGVKLEDFASYAYLSHYDNIAKAVLHEDFDAGILKDSVMEKFEPQGLRVLYTSPPLASYLFAVNSKLPAKTSNKIKNALLELKPDTPENKEILSVLDPGYDGFETAKDQDYNVIRKLIAPFQKK